jgi:hypothetical protein
MEGWERRERRGRDMRGSMPEEVSKSLCRKKLGGVEDCMF